MCGTLIGSYSLLIINYKSINFIVVINDVYPTPAYNNIIIPFVSNE